MTDYKGPDRRSVITFTREDSDRLVRLETQLQSNSEKSDTIINQLTETNSKIAIQNGRVSKLENRQSWIMGVGAAIVFIISAVLGLGERK